MCCGAILGHVEDCCSSLGHTFNIISSNCPVKNSGAYCRAGSVLLPCVHARQIGGDREGRVGSKGLWVKGQCNIRHPSPLCINQERAEGQAGKDSPTPGSFSAL